VSKASRSSRPRLVAGVDRRATVAISDGVGVEVTGQVHFRSVKSYPNQAGSCHITTSIFRAQRKLANEQMPLEALAWAVTLYSQRLILPQRPRAPRRTRRDSPKQVDKVIRTQSRARNPRLFEGIKFTSYNLGEADPASRNCPRRSSAVKISLDRLCGSSNLETDSRRRLVVI
jgi:hypothetical protein